MSYRENHKCDDACGWATTSKDSCICSCGGDNHGSYWGNRDVTRIWMGVDPFARFPRVDDDPW